MAGRTAMLVAIFTTTLCYSGGVVAIALVPDGVRSSGRVPLFELGLPADGKMLQPYKLPQQNQSSLRMPRPPIPLQPTARLPAAELLDHRSLTVQPGTEELPLAQILAEDTTMQDTTMHPQESAGDPTGQLVAEELGEGATADEDLLPSPQQVAQDPTGQLMAEELGEVATSEDELLPSLKQVAQDPTRQLAAEKLGEGATAHESLLPPLQQVAQAPTGQLAAEELGEGGTSDEDILPSLQQVAQDPTGQLAAKKIGEGAKIDEDPLPSLQHVPQDPTGQLVAEEPGEVASSDDDLLPSLQQVTQDLTGQPAAKSLPAIPAEGELQSPQQLAGDQTGQPMEEDFGKGIPPLEQQAVEPEDLMPRPNPIQEQIDSMNKDTTELQNAITGLKEQLVGSKEELKTKSSIAKKMDVRMKQIRQKLEQGHKQLKVEENKLHRQQARFQEEETHARGLQEQLEKLTASSREGEAQEQKVGELQQALGMERAAFTQHAEQDKNEIGSLWNELKSHNRTLEERNSKIAELEATLKHLQGDAGAPKGWDVRKASLERNLKQLQIRLQGTTNLESVNNDLKKQLDGASSQIKMKEELKHEITQLSQKLQQAIQPTQNAETLANNWKKLQAEQAALRQQEEQQEEQQRKIENLTEQLEMTKKAVGNFGGSTGMHVTSTSTEQLMRKNEKLKYKAGTLKKEIEALQETFAVVQNGLEQLVTDGTSAA